MPPVHGKNTCIAIDASDVSAFFKDFSVEGDAELVDVTMFTAQYKSFIVGYKDGKASASGIFGSKDPAVVGAPNEIDDILAPILGDDTKNPLVTGSLAGFGAFGNPASFFQAKLPKYSVQSPATGVVSVMAELQSTTGINAGVLLAEEIARTTTGQSAAYDLGAASSAGFTAQLHAFAVGATTSVTVTIEDSADGSTGWAQIGAFTAANAAGAQRIVVAGAVRRYVRVKWTFTGSNGATLIVAFALGN